MAGHRVDRVSEDIKREIMAIVRELKDPRVQDKLLTVARVEVSADASFAKVYISAMEGIEVAKTAVKALKKQGILVRRFDTKGIEQWLRITIGTAEQMSALKKSMETI